MSDAILKAMRGQPLLMSPRGLPAMAAMAQRRAGTPPPWESAAWQGADDHGGGGGGGGRSAVCDPEGPSGPDRELAAKMEWMACPVERRRARDGRECVVMRIEGSLAFDSTLAWYWGLWTPAVAAQLNALAEEAELGLSRVPVVLRMQCYGGQNWGITDLVAAMKRLAAARPVVALANEGMWSLAYWFGCFSRRVVATRSACVGSIGSRNTIASFDEMNKEMGIDVRILSSGDKKVAGDPDRPISDADEAYVKSFVMKSAEEFFAVVSAARGIPVETIRAMEGAEFVGEDARTNGLVDEVIDDVEAYLDAVSADPRVGVAGAGSGPGYGASGPARSQAMYKTVEELRAACGSLVQQIEDAAHAKGVEQGTARAKSEGVRSATPAELREQFPEDENAVFREACLAEGRTMSAAVAQMNKLLVGRLESKNTELAEANKKLAALGGAGRDLEASSRTLNQAGGGGGGGGGDAAKVSAFGASVEASIKRGESAAVAIDLAKKQHGAETHVLWNNNGCPGLKKPA